MTVFNLLLGVATKRAAGAAQNKNKLRFILVVIMVFPLFQLYVKASQSQDASAELAHSIVGIIIMTLIWIFPETRAFEKFGETEE